jgi:hypothetical protein
MVTFTEIDYIMGAGLLSQLERRPQGDFIRGASLPRRARFF